MTDFDPELDSEGAEFLAHGIEICAGMWNDIASTLPESPDAVAGVKAVTMFFSGILAVSSERNMDPTKMMLMVATSIVAVHQWVDKLTPPASSDN